MSEIYFDKKEQHFATAEEDIKIPDKPLTVTLQITRKCNLRCIYCSESEYIPDPSFEVIKKMIGNLQGVKRVIIAGGEPLLRDDLLSILRLCRDNFEVVAMASNAVNLTSELAKQIYRYVDYVDVTIDGPRAIHNIIRGEYDKIIQGLWNLKNEGVEFSIVMVLLESNMEWVPYVAQIADVLGAKKLKILSPIPKGRGKQVVTQRLSSENIRKLFERLKFLKEHTGWNVRITVTDWERIKEGHALLVHPNGDVVASPVWTTEGCIEYIGNTLRESISKIWDRYPYKENHVKKYIEKSLTVC